eukprot:CAMPEP_0178464940 /NCGR_PEP_ID=MMETSP0689_2-20121128/51097_1 /TAXON_ID=160604 /ORGANISM="Amphidinium massartii, Strain CS-259" /LENGTH=77 /DNA_ID=CAMNT_0020091849 /DNA_START=583 /DNA_END=816 /DNA_ORIENTATION=+
MPTSLMFLPSRNIWTEVMDTSFLNATEPCEKIFTKPNGLKVCTVITSFTLAFAVGSVSGIKAMLLTACASPKADRAT